MTKVVANQLNSFLLCLPSVVGWEVGLTSNLLLSLYVPLRLWLGGWVGVGWCCFVVLFAFIGGWRGRWWSLRC